MPSFNRLRAFIRLMRTLIHRRPSGRAIWRFFVNLDEHNAPRIASAMAFDAFLSIIPLLALAGWFFEGSPDGGRLLIIKPFFTAAPGPIAHLADEEFLRLSDVGAAAVAPVSLIAFFWVSSSGISTAMGALETIFRIASRPWWARRAIAILLVLGGLVGASLAATIIIAVASSLGSIGTTFIALVIPFAIAVGLVAGLFRISVRHAIRPRVLPGAVATVTAWLLISAAFSVYVRTLARFSTLYGGLATVAMLLFWMWLLALALLGGAEVNAALELHAPVSERPPR